MSKFVWSIGMIAAFTCGLAWGEDDSPPLPFHTVEGNSGVFITPTAYLTNPPKEGQTWGLPSISVSAAIMEHVDFQSFGITENVLGRFELGYAMERLGLNDWPGDVRRVTGRRIDNEVYLHNFNLRALLLEEGAFDSGWLPAVTVGAHFKWNDGVTDIDRQLNGTCDALGADRAWGTEFTVTASKTFTELLPRPVILTAGLRNSDAIHTGLLGFAGERATTFEGSAIVFLTDRLMLASEYRQKSDLLDHKGSCGLIGEENDWWDICLGYIVNKHLTIAGGYAHFGHILNHREDNVWAFQLKYEF
ncbi:MAG TPA: DUF3034 family protein [Anaerohalosphaeraceae bacterium]|jgi:hypothetical protein|nr:DUF3034 family protein [Anaerohalosphaeraceae bacterium]HRT50640.1 DUF3034 family protein [Anaerohalosphaeraceae bacterium]HRT86535.1 DUF3034 family protein [Anaerohalosphaeraceae bacterium]